MQLNVAFKSTHPHPQPQRPLDIAMGNGSASNDISWEWEFSRTFPATPPPATRFPCSVAAWLHFRYTYWMHVVHSSDPPGKMEQDEGRIRNTGGTGGTGRKQAAQIEWIEIKSSEIWTFVWKAKMEKALFVNSNRNSNRGDTFSRSPKRNKQENVSRLWIWCDQIGALL